MKLDASALTDSGKERLSNEDHVWSQVFTNSQDIHLGLFIVCDGMGGHLGGECASYWATEAIKQALAPLFCPRDPRATVHLPPPDADGTVKFPPYPVKMTDKELENLALQAIQKANRVVFNYSQQKPEEAAEAGTTLTMAVVRGEKALIANVGDSRTYILRNQELNQITTDHSLVARMVAGGQIEPDEIYTHPQRNMIYRSLGQRDQVKVDFYWETMSSGDYLLLCSDGLWEMMKDPAVMAQIIQEAPTLEQACKDLVEAANTAGGMDNIGLVLAKYS